MNAPWSATVLTIFPEMFPGPLGSALSGKALNEGRWSLDAVSLRDFTRDRHKSVDDTPFGGGAGMIMRPDVIGAATDFAHPAGDLRPLIYLTPRGRRLDQSMVEEFAVAPGIVALCGRYEGVDQRAIEAKGFLEVSVGDFVLSGGEIAAMILLDAIVRLLPGVVGRRESVIEESFSSGLLEYPQYTRPQLWDGREVPEVLLSGNHARIRAWRMEMALQSTRERRPDLLKNAS
ncbi:MAG: tRNA (guanosine(37)-N1)-methyltransferase TrmD [Geminicoccaceae bacterium]|nr:tRNA (guanosine(37)-N1)-methyltransferase TrmD [Geminicoccaceae bacterium]